MRRERDVMALVVSGLLNKQVGGELGISEITVIRGAAATLIPGATSTARAGSF